MPAPIAKIGDLIPKSGIFTEPGVVIGRKDDGTLLIDTDPLSVNKYHRYSNTTGLSLEEKNKFNKILDSIYKNDDAGRRIDEIQKEIDKLRLDAGNKNVVQYLKNQQAQLIRESKYLPRFYAQDEGSLKF